MNDLYNHLTLIVCHMIFLHVFDIGWKRTSMCFRKQPRKQLIAGDLVISKKPVWPACLEPSMMSFTNISLRESFEVRAMCLSSRLSALAWMSRTWPSCSGDQHFVNRIRQHCAQSIAGCLTRLHDQDPKGSE